MCDTPMTPDAFMQALKDFLIETTPARIEKAGLFSMLVYKLAHMLKEEIEWQHNIPASIEVLAQQLAITAKQSQEDVAALGALFYAMNVFLKEKNGSE